MAWGVTAMVRSADPTVLQFPDENDYWSLARSLARGDGLVGEHGFGALRMPLFPALLTPFALLDRGVVYAKVAMWPVGALAALFAALLGAKIGGRATGLTAGLAVACDPFLTFFSSLLLTETAFIAALVGLWLTGWDLQFPRKKVHPSKWLLVGGLCALCVYLRESSAGLCALWIAFLMVRRRWDRSSLVGGGVAIAVIVCLLLPWAIRNQRVTGQMCWLTHRAGISLYDGVRPGATGASDLGDVKQMPAVRSLDEVNWNRWFLDESVRAIRAEPTRILRLAFVKIARTWNPVPNADTYRSKFVRFVSAAWTLPVYALAVIGAIRLGRRDAGSVLALLLPAAFVLVMHAVFVGSVRYRLIAMPMLEVLAAVGAVALITRRKAISDPESPPPRDP